MRAPRRALVTVRKLADIEKLTSVEKSAVFKIKETTPGINIDRKAQVHNGLGDLLLVGALL